MVRHSYSYTKAYVIFKDKLRDARGHSSTCTEATPVRKQPIWKAHRMEEIVLDRREQTLTELDGIQGCIMQTLRTTWGERRQTLRDELWSLERSIKV